MTTLIKNQTRQFRADYTDDGEPRTLIATVRHDDQRGNGHNTFSITAELYEPHPHRGEPTIRHESGKTLWLCSGGQLQDEIRKHIPELAPLLKWHLVSTDGPLHYIANTVYHASDRDHRGLRKGECKQLRNGRTNKPVWQRVMRDASGEIVSDGSGSWMDSHEQPTEELTAAWEPVWIEGEGKARELDHARSSAVWPDATDEELTAAPEELTAALQARLPALMAEFRAAVESLGFTY